MEIVRSPDTKAAMNAVIQMPAIMELADDQSVSDAEFRAQVRVIIREVRDDRCT